MFSLGRQLLHSGSKVGWASIQIRGFHPGMGGGRPHRRRNNKHFANDLLKKPDTRSEWWIVDGEMHEIGESVPPRERFVIPRDNISNRRRKQIREQFMRRTRLILKEPEYEPWCRRYMELYNELRENWERLYWDEGYSKKIAQDHANYDSAEDDTEDFNPYRRAPPRPQHMQGYGPGMNGQDDTREKVSLIRDKFEYDREKRMQEKAFAPMTGGHRFGRDDSVSRNQPFDPQNYFSGSEDE